MTIAVVSVLKGIVAIVSVFLVCIVLHEFGHFWVAKRSGVAVPAFAVGFGPKLVRWTLNGTEFSIRLFPIGGLVQLAGEIPQDALFRKGEQIAFRLNADGRVAVLGDPLDVRGGQVGILKDLDLMHRLEMTIDTGDEVRTYQLIPHAKLMTNARNSIPLVERHEQVLGKPLWQRAAIILAGPVMNFLLAGVLFTAWFAHTGFPTAVVGQLVPGDPAATAGMRPGDRVVAVDNRPIHGWTEFVNAVRSDTSRPPHPLRIRVERDGTTQELVVTPKLVDGNLPQIGMSPVFSHNLIDAVGTGFANVYYGSVNAVQAYWQVLSQHQFSSLAGPVGIADVINQQAQSGFWHVVMIAGLLSLNLGLFNLLPIPALDGGRLLFMIVEMFRGKAVDPRKEGLVHLVGFGLLMLFAVVITYRDVTRLF
ncbi:RIP metalloprotease RseP [Alicyclobacillus contaminans]|uniref:RIP metalloprotease RseP n=1 Tax=Alicyclobacillus contaminans TaxID=392016 RepID=UPI0003F531AB|nr:RIP metalloprotease RseP [Alicyclobacillus contaminans]